MTGGGRIFGNWNADHKSIKLKWNEGHVWSVSILTDELPNEGEYKYVIIEGENVKRWASGDNKRYNIEQFGDTISKTQISPETFKYEYQPSLSRKVEYDPSTKELSICDSFE